MSKILFSPIGGSDPIRNYKDGSMLHICRNYLPDKVVLYLSYEMCQHHKADNRYLYCLEKLGELLHHTFEVKLIERPELRNVQSYEIFYNDFIKCIEHIEQEMTEEDELYINISSGTPAMKNALLMLSVLTEYPLKTIQISTPLKRSNYTDENIDNYEVQAQWECNEDNTGLLENRCEEIQPVNLTKLIKLNLVKKHISSYDYFAAYQVVADMERLLPSKGLMVMKQAIARIQLNTIEVNVIAKQTGYQPMPVTREKDCELIEYILLLQIKLKRKEYDDFIRAITPTIVILFERALIKQCKINLDMYCSRKKKVKIWDRKKMQNTEVLDILRKGLGGEFKFGPVYSIHLKILICTLSENKELNQLVDKIRHIEETARNCAAHTIVSIREDTIENWTGCTPNEIMENIKTLSAFVEPDFSGEIWNSYDEMNKKICMELEIK